MHDACGWIGNVVLHPSRFDGSLTKDVVHQLLAPNAGNVLHPSAHFGRVAAKGEIVPLLVKHKHVHVAVKESM